MKFVSPRFGPIEVARDKILSFPRGLPGFPDCTEFILMDHDRETPLRWLQCVDRPEIAFVVVEPSQVLGSYAIEVPPHVLASLGWSGTTHTAEDVVTLLVLNIEGRELWANLRAPLIVNAATRRACQMILEDPSLPLRHPLHPADAEPEPTPLR
jgi:flagellar assembly factor FliW